MWVQVRSTHLLKDERWALANRCLCVRLPKEALQHLQPDLAPPWSSGESIPAKPCCPMDTTIFLPWHSHLFSAPRERRLSPRRKYLGDREEIDCNMIVEGVATDSLVKEAVQ